MKAIRIHTFGNEDVLKLENVTPPVPGNGEVRIKIEAIGVNFVDIYYRTGQYPSQLPLIPGMEAAGVIEAVGSDVSQQLIGKRVAYAMHLGAYADYAVVPSWKLVPVPDAMTFQQAAAVLLQGLTAHFLSYSMYPFEPNSVVLVHAAAGGVGKLLVQLLKRRGVRVIGTVSTEQKGNLAREAGVDDIIYYTQGNFQDEVRDLTQGKGVDVVYDSVGRTTYQQSLRCLRPRGLLVLFGQSSGSTEPIDPQILRTLGSLYLTRPSLTHYIANRDELLQRASAIFHFVARGELNIKIDDTFPLHAAKEAHRYLEERRTTGKVLLLPEPA